MGRRRRHEGLQLEPVFKKGPHLPPQTPLYTEQNPQRAAWANCRRKRADVVQSAMACGEILRHREDAEKIVCARVRLHGDFEVFAGLRSRH